MPLIHSLELERIEPLLLLQQLGRVALAPERLTHPTRVELGGRGGLERLEVEVEPATLGEGVDVAPASIQLAGAEIELVSVMARESVLRFCLEGVRDEYDYVFIDCPPSLGLLTLNALVASDALLIPIQCEYYALEGLSKLLESMKMVKGRLNTGIEVFGVVMTMYDVRTSLSKQVVEEVRSYFKDKVFETVIPRNVRLSEAPSFGLPVSKYAPASKGAIAYAALAQEVVDRG
jgi:chromosome partitioning protein